MKKIGRMPISCVFYTAALVAGIAAAGYGVSCLVRHCGGSSSGSSCSKASSSSSGGGCCKK